MPRPPARPDRPSPQPSGQAPLPAELPLRDDDDVRRLGEALRSADFTVDALHALLGPAAVVALGRGDVVPALRATTGGSRLETLVRLLVLDTPVTGAAAAAALQPLPLERALAAGLLTADGDDVRPLLDVQPHAADDVDLVVVSDLDRGSVGRPHELRPDHVLGIGAASTLLASLTVRDPVETALDVGTGCGVQALHLLPHVARVTATDTNPRALALARISALLSGVAVPELLPGDLLEPVAGRRFDLVVSNPPFVIGPSRRFSYRDSGLPGDEVSRRLVGAMAEHLTPGGTAQLLASWLHVQGQDWRDRVGGWAAATGCDAWVVQRAAVDPAEHVHTWLRDAGEEGSPQARARSEEWLADLAARGVEAVGFGFVTLRRTSSEQPDVHVEELLGPLPEPMGPHVLAHLGRRELLRELPDELLRLLPLQRAAGLRLDDTSVPGPEGWERTARRLVQGAGMGRVAAADDAVAALVVGCDGTRPVGDLLTVLETVLDVDADAALPVVRSLVADGFLEPVTS